MHYSSIRCTKTLYNTHIYCVFFQEDQEDNFIYLYNFLSECDIEHAHGCIGRGLNPRVPKLKSCQTRSPRLTLGPRRQFLIRKKICCSLQVEYFCWIQVNKK